MRLRGCQRVPAGAADAQRESRPLTAPHLPWPAAREGTGTSGLRLMARPTSTTSSTEVLPAAQDLGYHGPFPGSTIRSGRGGRLARRAGMLSWFASEQTFLADESRSQQPQLHIGGVLHGHAQLLKK